MKLTQLHINGFKNLQNVSFSPHPAYNLIFGENAQGKTNLIEAIWVLTGCKSFRGTKERDYLPFSGGDLSVEASFEDARRTQTLRLHMIPGGSVPEKKFWRNDIPHKASELFSVFHCVVFTPEDLILITGGPERRRSFLDLCSAQLYAPMLNFVRRYQLVLHQRNSLLKQKLSPEQTKLMLSVWDEQLVKLGTELSIRRAAYVRKLAETCVPLYRRIAGDRESISIHYASSVFGRDAQDLLPEQETPELLEHYRERLAQSRSSDLMLGHTGVGAHRDDLVLWIDGKPAREFGSQGQKKSLALALKLAQAENYRDRQKETPVVLLDDVMGELDESRQRVVATMVQGMQVFVTTCHPESVLYEGEGKRIVIAQGRLRESSSTV